MKSLSLPDIVIHYNRFLDPIFIGYIKAQPEFVGWKVPTKSEVLQKVAEYQKAWKKEEVKIVESLCALTGLFFKENIIYVHVVSGNPRQFSNPIVIRSGFSPDVFVNVVTHELIHKLFSNNLDKVHSTIFKDLFPGEAVLAQEHVIVHALLKYVYLDVLDQPERLKENIERSEKSSHREYQRAWEIVEKEGYINLLKTFVDKIKNAPV